MYNSDHQRKNNRKKPKGKRTPLGTLLQQFTGPVFGIKTDDCPRWKNDTVAKKWNAHREQFWQWKIPFHAINQHESGKGKLKVSASLYTQNGLTLVYIDPDAHDGKGNPEHARLLINEFSRRHNLNLPEPVITERGGSAWIVVRTLTEYRTGFYKRASEDDYNAMVRRLQAYLRSLAKEMQLDLSGVEVLGKVYEPKMIDGQILGVKAGDLIKPPPSEEWFTQQPVNWTRFLGAEFDEIQEDKVPAKEISEENTPAVSDYSASSFSPALVTQKIIDRIPSLESFVEKNFLSRPTKVDRWAITDRAFVELLLSMFLLAPNSDGSNPVARHEAFVNTLHEQGIFEFAYNHHRFKAVRDYLSAVGCLAWTDNSYDFATHKASRWTLDDEIRGQVNTVLTAETPTKQLPITLIDTKNEEVVLMNWTKCKGKNLRPVYKPQEDEFTRLMRRVDHFLHDWHPSELLTSAA